MVHLFPPTFFFVLDKLLASSKSFISVSLVDDAEPLLICPDVLYTWILKQLPLEDLILISSEAPEPILFLGIVRHGDLHSS